MTDDYRKINKLGRIPSFEGSDGYILTECMAIAIYRTFISPSHACLCKSCTYYDEDHIQFQLSLSERLPVENVFTL